MQLHRRIPGRLEAGYGIRAGEITSLLAVHFERGGDTLQAVHHWQQAGENAGRPSAYYEAIATLRKALALLAMLADSPERTQRELALQLTLGELLMAAQRMASADAGEAYIRAHALCQQAGETPQLFRVLSRLFVFHNAQARLYTGREFGGRRPSCIGSKGALLLQLPILDAHQAEACFQQALDVARSQQAKALELRAAMSLSRLWQRQGKWDAARTLLAPIYGWFTEGFNTPDLQEAMALLTERS